MPSVRAILSVVHPWSILAVGFAVLCAYAYPGDMSYDSFEQLRQVRSGVYTDWHPPAMTALWHVCEYVVAGPLGMLVLQLITFLAGSYLVMRRWLAPTAASIVAVAMLWFPPIGTLMAVIWKDPMMLGFLMLGLGLLVREGRAMQLSGLVAFAVASAMRHNAFTITLPLVMLLFQWSPTHMRVRRYALGLAAWVAVTGAAFGVNTVLTDRHEYLWSSSLALTDISGTIRFAPPMSDDELRAILDGAPLVPTHDIQATITHAYSALDPLAIFDRHIFTLPTTDAERSAVARAWETLTLDHPTAFLRNRWHVFRQLIQLPRPARTESVWVGISGDDPDLWHDDPPAWQMPLRQAALSIGMSWLVRPVFYLELILVLSPFWIRIRDRVVNAMVLSVATCVGTLFLVSPAATFRYLVWVVVVAIITTVVLVVKRAAPRVPV